ncbi:MAG: hypothetical protein PWP53_2932 [Lacrimispora sp.]|jgi:hypothetical protein|nr:hypothetical protein [Lacrimispora sp.]
MMRQPRFICTDPFFEGCVKQNHKKSKTMFMFSIKVRILIEEDVKIILGFAIFYRSFIKFCVLELVRWGNISK